MSPRTIFLTLDLFGAMAAAGQAEDTSATASDTIPAAILVPDPGTNDTSNATRVSIAPEEGRPFFSLPTYRISVGASFDFFEKFKASNIYGDLIIDLPQVLRTKRTTCGFLGGIYQVRSVTVDSFIPEQLYMVSSTPLASFQWEEGGDSAIVHAASAGGVKKLVTDNQCFFAALYRPWYLAEGTPGSSGLYHLFYFGLLNRRDRVSESYTSTSDDEIFISGQPDLPPLPRDRQYTEVRTDMLLGYGQMLRHEFDDFALQCYGTITGMPSPWRAGFIMSFTAVGSRSGLIAGAEIRMDPLVGTEQYNVFLAKTFKLAEMARLITSY